MHQSTYLSWIIGTLLMLLSLASALDYEICKDVKSTSCWFWDQEFAVFSKTLGQWEGNQAGTSRLEAMSFSECEYFCYLDDECTAAKWNADRCYLFKERPLTMYPSDGEPDVHVDQGYSVSIKGSCADAEDWYKGEDWFEAGGKPHKCCRTCRSRLAGSGSSDSQETW